MSRMDREVNIDVIFRSKHGPGFGWFANVLDRHNEMIHQTEFYGTGHEAASAAERWATGNGYVTVPF